ncbi:MFS transporter [Streptomyces sp. NPDC054796]
MLPLLLVSMDVSVLYFAVPAISADLAPSAAQQLWIFDIYAFVLAGLLITMGSLGDRIGRRRLLLLGAVAFGAASVTAAYATSAELLIAARALLGIGGATLMPSTLALVRNLFLDARQRAAAIGVWSAVMTGGVALGSVLSGVLVEHFWWGSVFLVNVPAMLLLLALAPVLIPESRDPEPGRFDLLSVPLSMAAVLPVIYGLKRAAEHGPDGVSGLAVLAGLGFTAAFVRRQRTREAPMISPDLFRERGYASAVVLNLVAAFAMMGSAYFTTQYLQSVLGMGALEAALWSLAPSVAIGAAAPVATTLVQRGADRARVVCGGFLVAAAGFGVLGLCGTDSLVTVLVGAGVLACGIVTVMSQLTDLALGAVPPRRAGTASSVLETGQEFGGALGMALLGSVGAALYRRDLDGSLPGGLPARAAEAARETLGGAAAVAERLHGRTGEAVLGAAREAFTHGMRGAALVAVVVLVGAALVSVRALGQERGRGRVPETARSGTRTGAPADVPGDGSGAPGDGSGVPPSPGEGAEAQRPLSGS